MFSMTAQAFFSLIVHFLHKLFINQYFQNTNDHLRDKTSISVCVITFISQQCLLAQQGSVQIINLELTTLFKTLMYIYVYQQHHILPLLCASLLSSLSKAFKNRCVQSRKLNRKRCLIISFFITHIHCTSCIINYIEGVESAKPLKKNQ